MNPSPQSDVSEELHKALAVFQDYTASWVFPMNQEAHYKGLANIEQALLNLIDREKLSARIEELQPMMDILVHQGREMYEAWDAASNYGAERLEKLQQKKGESDE